MLLRAKRATYLTFAGAGFAGASWATRIPQLRDRLELDPASLGLVLLALAVGSVLALPLAGAVVSRLGSRRVVTGTAVLAGAALSLLGCGYVTTVWLVVVALFLLGLANGTWDVAMNVQGAAVERMLGHSIMSRFHAGFSLGTVAGALVGAVMIALGVPVTLHLLAVGIVVAVDVPWQARGFVPDLEPDHPSAEAGEGPGRALAAWREPRTVLIGVVVFTFAFAEGTGQDWIAVSVVDGYRSTALLGTLAFATFLTAMTAGRWFGPGVLDRYGRVAVIRVLAVLGIVGLLAFVLGSNVPWAFVGSALWGLGISLGFPTGMTAGADEPRHAAVRVSVIASIGYCAFLAGPPLIGFLGRHDTVLRGLLVVPALLGVAVVLAPVLRPRDREPASSSVRG